MLNAIWADVLGNPRPLGQAHYRPPQTAGARDLIPRNDG